MEDRHTGKETALIVVKIRTKSPKREVSMKTRRLCKRLSYRLLVLVFLVPLSPLRAEVGVTTLSIVHNSCTSVTLRGQFFSDEDIEDVEWIFGYWLKTDTSQFTATEFQCCLRDGDIFETTVTDLQPDTDYEFWAQVLWLDSSSGGRSVSGTTSTDEAGFTTLSCAGPILPSPRNGAVNESDIPILSWRQASGSTADRYFVYFSTEPELVNACDPNVLLGSTVEPVFMPRPILVRGTTYYWKVVSESGEYTLNPSQIWSFEVLGTTANRDVTQPGDTVQGVPNNQNWLGHQGPDRAINNNGGDGDQFLHSGDSFGSPLGIRITPSMGSTIVTELCFTSGGDPNLDPTRFELYGSNGSIDGPYTLIASGPIGEFSARFTQTEKPSSFDNDVAYLHYELLLLEVSKSSESRMAISEIKMIGEPFCSAAFQNCIFTLAGRQRDALNGSRLKDGLDPNRKSKMSLGVVLVPVNAFYEWPGQLVPGRYDVELQRPGFYPQGPTEVRVRTDENTLRDFILWPDGVIIPSRPIYRFGRPHHVSDCNYFTADISNVNDLLYEDADPPTGSPDPCDPDNWVYNGIAFCAWDANTADPLKLEPVHRFLLKDNEPNIPAYAFDVDDLEGDPNDWMPDTRFDANAVAFWAYPPSAPPTNNGTSDFTDVFRLWSTSLHCYYYTTDSTKATDLAMDPDWDDKGTAWHALACPARPTP